MTEQSRERNHAETERHCPGHYCGSAADPDQLIASYQDKKALKKELDERQKEKAQAS